ncbi:MAG: helix-turn-helix domain-containing protein [Candidatus Ancillula sp.]|nr:helix-turn-helix domain-containing protein [Candidatus Ancillula sp.]
MTKYTHLSIAERQRISKLSQENYSIRSIAKHLDRNPSTFLKRAKARFNMYK